MRICFAAAIVLAAGSAAVADTTLLRDHVYAVDEGVAITLGNFASLDYTFSWSDGSGDFIDIVDPTLILTAGQTYTFQRVTTGHPFVITDDTLQVEGTDGSYNRLTLDRQEIDDATLKPIEDFTADPGPTDDMIVWTPADADAGVYYYTCRVIAHSEMTGRIRVVQSCIADFNGDAAVNTVDVLAFLNAWSVGSATADVNFDGAVNTADVLAFLNLWNAGC